MANLDHGAGDKLTVDGAVDLGVDVGGAGELGLRPQQARTCKVQDELHWSFAAVASRSFAKSRSLVVMPPASWLVRSTMTRL